MESLWRQTVTIPQYPSLSENITTQVAVIGGGLAGILTAYLLQKQGASVVVLEARSVGSGQTGNTTAKITSQHNLIYKNLIDSLGEEQAAAYANANQQAILAYKALIEAKGIDCLFEERPAYLYSTASEDADKLEQEYHAAQKLGIKAEFTGQTDLPFPVVGALRFCGQAQFHPLKFLAALAQELTIYENTRVLTVSGGQVTTEKGTVMAQQVVFACHYPFVNVPGYYFSRLYQQRSYVLALEQAATLDGMYLGVEEQGLSFRNSGRYLLLGGGGHRTGENKEGGKYQLLQAFAREYYPGSIEAARWSAQDCMTPDQVPFIGRFSSSCEDWYVATGFCKWGMTSSMAAATLLCDLVSGRENPAAEIFSPQRSRTPQSVKMVLENGAQAVKGVSKRIFLMPGETPQQVEPEHGEIVQCSGHKCGVYSHEHHRFGVSVRCPHMGCQLEWNPDEKSWDCPCHGSRFDYHGEVLDGPAQQNLEETLNE